MILKIDKRHKKSTIFSEHLLIEVLKVYDRGENNKLINISKSMR